MLRRIDIYNVLRQDIYINHHYDTSYSSDFVGKGHLHKSTLNTQKYANDTGAAFLFIFRLIYRAEIRDLTYTEERRPFERPGYERPPECCRPGCNWL